MADALKRDCATAFDREQGPRTVIGRAELVVEDAASYQEMLDRLEELEAILGSGNLAANTGHNSLYRPSNFGDFNAVFKVLHQDSSRLSAPAVPGRFPSLASQSGSQQMIDTTNLRGRPGWEEAMNLSPFTGKSSFFSSTDTANYQTLTPEEESHVDLVPPNVTDRTAGVAGPCASKSMIRNEMLHKC
jgi:hypothetical protein